jgi:hypothetical protein
MLPTGVAPDLIDPGILKLANNAPDRGSQAFKDRGNVERMHTGILNNCVARIGWIARCARRSRIAITDCCRAEEPRAVKRGRTKKAAFPPAPTCRPTRRRSNPPERQAMGRFVSDREERQLSRSA